MQHLESERIAAFDHEAPTAGELAHLEACATCRAERAEFSALSKRALLLIDAPVYPTTPRLTTWDSLSSRLRAEGLIVSAADESSGDGSSDARIPAPHENLVSLDSRRAQSTPRVRNEWWRMAAAAVMLVAGGAVWGRFSETASAIGPRSTQLPVIASDVAGSIGLGNTGFSSMEEASNALAKIERDFNRTSLWMTANDPTANASDVLRRRLAQLDQVVAASNAAWAAAPQDRVLEHYYRSAYAARELTIQQLGNALPPGRSLERF